jgi:hypothetical protein
MDVRKISVTRETVFADTGKSITRPVTRVLAIAASKTRLPAALSTTCRHCSRAEPNLELCCSNRRDGS